MWQRGGQKESFFSIFLAETCRGWERVQVFQKWRVFGERVCNFSLGFPGFGSSDFFGPRSKVVLLSEGFEWAPVWGSFNKLREVGVLSYLFYPLFKCFANA